ncbi:MAG TPA: class I SAM-dependent methyltransferase [Tepidisphaeraceae bacterium]|jgi:SAM-dependent methyltransferase|nr:class I SAM-dependent methyltransferase [Tepidisphaeraceae bacterium]
MSVRHNGTALAVMQAPITAVEIGKLGQSSLTTAPPVLFRDLEQMVSSLLERVGAEFRANPNSAGPAMFELQSELRCVKQKTSPEVWQDIAALCLAHPVSRIFHEDPFTGHCFRKPRGYAGDAELLDYLYGISDAPSATSPIGRSIFHHMMEQQGALSVRSRGKILAQVIDETADTRPSPRILSIACGHLREGHHSKALAEGRIGEFIAFDQDADSLAHVSRAFAGKGVKTVSGSVKSILGEKMWFEGFDLVYAAGLYDYLSERVAIRLTRMMFDMLAPGGRLLVANFAPTLPEVGYMETFMDWKLIYRTAEEMARLSSDIPGDEWKSNRLFWDEPENIVFLDVVKRAKVKPIMEFRGAGRKFNVPGRQFFRGQNRLSATRRTALGAPDNPAAELS